MAVITKFVVVRHGVELDKEFLVKKEAEAYDKMLDAADSLADLIKGSGLDVDLDESTIDAIAVFLAKNGPEVSRILKGIKPLAQPAKNAAAKSEEDPSGPAKKKIPTTKAKSKDK